PRGPGPSARARRGARAVARLARGPWSALASAAPAALHEIDDQRHAVHRVAGAEAVLEEVGVVARDPRAGVDLDRKAGRAHPDLGHVDQLQAMLAASPA